MSTRVESVRGAALLLEAHVNGKARADVNAFTLSAQGMPELVFADSFNPSSAKERRAFVARLPEPMRAEAERLAVALGARIAQQRSARPKVAPSAPALEWPCTDLGNARRLVARHGRDLRYVRGLGWLCWDGRRFVLDESGQVERWAKATAIAIGAEEAPACLDDATRARLFKWASQSQSAGRLEAMIRLAETEPEVRCTAAALDAHPFLLNVLNGTLDLRTGELRPHQREDLLTKLAPVTYDLAAEAPLWMAFLRRTMDGSDEKIRFLQRAVGYSLTGDTSADVFFLLSGAGGNGKSTFLGTIRRTLGDFARAASFDTFLLRKGAGGPSGDVARLAGARFVLASEPDPGRRWDVGRLKAFTGGDPIVADFKHRDEFEFVPQAKLWFAANKPPQLLDASDGMRRRLRLVPFTVKLEPPDEHFEEKLTAELPGVLRWAVEGCRAWLQHGLGMPTAVKTASEAYVEEADVLGRFIEERCVVAPDAFEEAAPLYAGYERWCTDNHERPVSSTAFGRELPSKGFRKEKRGKIRYHGLRLATPIELEARVRAAEELSASPENQASSLPLEGFERGLEGLTAEFRCSTDSIVHREYLDKSPEPSTTLHDYSDDEYEALEREGLANA